MINKHTRLDKLADIENVSVSDMEDDNVSVSNRYSKYPYWNVLLESDFLQKVANPKYKERAENREEDRPPEPLIETPSWSLTILPEIHENIKTNFQTGSVNKRLRQRLKKNELKLKEQKSLQQQGRVFNIESDWDELYLVQRSLGLEDTRKYPDSDTSDNIDPALEDVLTYDMINKEESMPLLPTDIGRFSNKKKPSKMIQEIRQKISMAKSKEKAKLEAITELRKYRKPFKGFLRSKVNLFSFCFP